MKFVSLVITVSYGELKVRVKYLAYKKRDKKKYLGIQGAIKYNNNFGNVKCQNHRSPTTTSANFYKKLLKKSTKK